MKSNLISPISVAFYARYFHDRDESFFKIPDVDLVPYLGYASINSLRATLKLIGQDGIDFCRVQSNKSKIYFLRPEIFVGLTMLRGNSSSAPQASAVRKAYYDYLSDPQAAYGKLLDLQDLQAKASAVTLKKVGLELEEAEDALKRAASGGGSSSNSDPMLDGGFTILEEGQT